MITITRKDITIENHELRQDVGRLNQEVARLEHEIDEYEKLAEQNRIENRDIKEIVVTLANRFIWRDLTLTRPTVHDMDCMCLCMKGKFIQDGEIVRLQWDNDAQAWYYRITSPHNMQRFWEGPAVTHWMPFTNPGNELDLEK